MYIKIKKEKDEVYKKLYKRKRKTTSNVAIAIKHNN